MSEAAAPAVRVWDWPTRAFHWLLVATVVSAWASFEFAHKIGDNLLLWHRWNGYLVLVLLVFRLLWGFVGSSTARFEHFVHGPAFVLAYARDSLSGRKRAFLGHNPLGTLMVLALLALLFLQALLGLFALEHNELVAGPLKRLISDEAALKVTKWHIRVFKLIQLCVLAHVIANLLYALLARDPLIRAMISGTKPAKAYEDAPEARLAPCLALRAGIVLVIALVIVFGGILAAGGQLF